MPGSGGAQCWWRRREEVAQLLGLVSAIELTGEALLEALELWPLARTSTPSSEGSEELQARDEQLHGHFGDSDVTVLTNRCENFSRANALVAAEVGDDEGFADIA